MIPTRRDDESIVAALLLVLESRVFCKGEIKWLLGSTIARLGVQW